jgi:hypothetical protein
MKQLREAAHLNWHIMLEQQRQEMVFYVKSGPRNIWLM